MRKLPPSALARLEAKFRSAGKETMVNGERFVFASSRYLIGTFAKRISDGRIEQLSKGRYISSDLTVRKAIAGYFGLPTFHREKQQEGTTLHVNEEIPQETKANINAIADRIIELEHQQGNELTVTETYEDENAYEVTIGPVNTEDRVDVPSTQEETPSKGKHRSNTKQAEILRGLQSEEGITIGKIMAITGWKEPSARGILYRLFKKEMGLELTSKLNEFGERVYRV